MILYLNEWKATCKARQSQLVGNSHALCEQAGSSPHQPPACK